MEFMFDIFSSYIFDKYQIPLCEPAHESIRVCVSVCVCQCAGEPSLSLESSLNASYNDLFGKLLLKRGTCKQM